MPLSHLLAPWPSLWDGSRATLLRSGGLSTVLCVRRNLGRFPAQGEDAEGDGFWMPRAGCLPPGRLLGPPRAYEHLPVLRSGYYDWSSPLGFRPARDGRPPYGFRQPPFRPHVYLTYPRISFVAPQRGTTESLGLTDTCLARVPRSPPRVAQILALCVRSGEAPHTGSYSSAESADAAARPAGPVGDGDASAGPDSPAPVPASLRPYTFYLHYSQFNRRLDRWVAPGDLILSSLKRSEPPASTADRAALPPSALGMAGLSKRRPAKTRPSRAKSGKAKASAAKAGTGVGLVAGLGREGATPCATDSDSRDSSPGSRSLVPMSSLSSSLVLGPEVARTARGGDLDTTPRQALLRRASSLRNVASVQLGPGLLRPWYFSPIPGIPYPCARLYVCEHDLTYTWDPDLHLRHCGRCPRMGPPGRRVYYVPPYTVYEVDGGRHREYCERLSLVAKLFLDHKNLFFDTTHFLFYLLTTTAPPESANRPPARLPTGTGCGARSGLVSLATGPCASGPDRPPEEHLAAYFSKEKASLRGYNLSCILTFPHYQRRGIGRFLINLSYELSRRENRVGTPEKPLSDLGVIGYRSYWARILLQYLLGPNAPAETSLQALSKHTGLHIEDILFTLKSINILVCYGGQFKILLNASHRELVTRARDRPGIKLVPGKLQWAPYRC